MRGVRYFSGLLVLGAHLLSGSARADQLPAPSSAPASGVYTTVFTANWGANGNSNGTDYLTQIATDPGFTSVFIDAVGGNTSWTFSNLVPGTTYYTRVQAGYAQSNASAFTTLPTVTLPVSGVGGPPPVNPIISSETYNSITVTWGGTGIFGEGFAGYEIDASTASDFSGSLFTQTAAYSTTTILSGLGLASSTTYYVRVGSLYSVNYVTQSPPNYVLTIPASIVTDPSNQVTGLSAYQVTATSITWAWNPVPNATSYNVYLATSPSTLVTSVSASSFTDTGLAINALYGRMVAAVVGGMQGPLCAATSSYTLTLPPGAPTFTNVAFTSATVNWSANGNPDGTPYEITEAFCYGCGGYLIYYNGNFTSTTTFFSGLAEGSSYYFTIASRNQAGVRTYSPIGTLLTPGILIPTNVTATATGSTSITWTWDAPLGADDYALTSPSGGYIAPLGTSGLIDPEMGLIPNTAYERVIQAFGENVSGLTAAATAYTWAAVPGVPVFSNVEFTSATLTWSAQSNPMGTPYEVTQSTVSDFSSGVSTPIAFTSNFTDTTTTFMNLMYGTLYYFRIRAENGDGILTNFSANGSTQTLVFQPPTLISGTPQGTSSVTWTWSNATGATYNLYNANNSSLIASNIASTSYTEITLSTNTIYRRQVTAVLYGESAISNSVSTCTLASSPSSANPSGVQSTQMTAAWGANGNPAGTSYLVQASTDSGFGIVNASSNTTATSAMLAGLQPNTTYYLQVEALNLNGVATVFTGLPSTVTLATPPAAPTLTAIVLGVSSITWSWNAVVNAAGYTVLSSTGGSISANLSASTTFFTQIGLSTNTAYSNSVEAFNNGGASPSTFVTTYMLASAPSSASPTGVEATQMIAHWGANGNPPGTSYLVQASAGSGFGSIDTSSATTATSGILSGLQASTTYYMRVEALNGDGVATAFTTLPSTVTLGPPPAAPTLAAIALGVSSITWSWDAVPNAAGYTVVSSTGGTVSGNLNTSTTFFTQIGLSTNTAYANSVAAFNVSGASTSTPLTRYTLALPPIGSAVSQVSTSSITLSWDSQGNPAGTSYEAQLWQTGTSTTTLSGTATSAVFSNLSAGATYFVNVWAINGNGIATSPDITLSSVTLPNPNTVISVNPTSGQTIVFNGPDGPITLFVPAQSFPESVVITVQEPSSFPGAVSNVGQFQGTSVGIQISLNETQEPSQPVTLSIPFKDSDVTGLNKDELVLARYDATRNVWVPYVSQVDTVNDIVTAKVNHFSLYQIMGAVAPSTLDDVKIYPNPFRPALGETSITISNVPGNSRIRVYTLTGELVKDLSADAAGMASWDATNQSGQKVASGLYFVLVQGAGDKNMLRVVIQR